MIKIILILISVALIALVVTYSWFNRDSDRVILTLVTAMTLGSLGFITKESISNKTESVSKTFPVAVFYSIPNYTPLNIKLPYRFDLHMCLQNIKPTDLPKSETINFKFANKKYFDALQYLIVKTIFEKFGQGWNVNVKRIQTPSGESLSWSNSEGKGKEIRIKEFFKQIQNNYFVNLGMQNDIPDFHGGKAIFPPDISYNIETNDKYNSSLIKLNTKYISMEIKLSYSSSILGIGEYSKLFGFSPVLDIKNPGTVKLGHSVYMIEISIKQNYWLNGHPEMKKHRNWANSITELLNSQFNYEIIRDEHLRQFQLYGVEGIKSL